MEKSIVDILAAFRHQLWLEHIVVLDEFKYDDATLFVLDNAFLCPWEIQNLLRIAPFSILNLYYEGNLRMHLKISED